MYPRFYAPTRLLGYLIGMRSRARKQSHCRRFRALAHGAPPQSSPAGSASSVAVPRPLPRGVAGTPRFRPSPAWLRSFALCARHALLFSLAPPSLRRSAPSVPSLGVVALPSLRRRLLCAPSLGTPRFPPPAAFSALPLLLGGLSRGRRLRLLPLRFFGFAPLAKMRFAHNEVTAALWSVRVG